jgi:hypothetical protein
MSKGPQGQRRPADVNAAAVMVAKIATGEIEEHYGQNEGKDQAAVQLGRKGGRARAAKLTAEQRAEIAKRGGAARWRKS